MLSRVIRTASATCRTRVCYRGFAAATTTGETSGGREIDELLKDQRTQLEVELHDLKNEYIEKFEKASGGRSALPKQLYGDLGNNANLLFQSGQCEDQLELTAKNSEDLLNWCDLKTGFPKVSFFSKIASKQERSDDLASIVEGLDGGCSLGMKVVLKTIVDQKKTRDLPQILKHFMDLYRAHKKLVTGVLTLAEPWSREEIDNLLKDLSNNHLDPGSTLDVSVVFDPSILGGYSLTLRDLDIDRTEQTNFYKVYDTFHHSISSELKKEEKEAHRAKTQAQRDSDAFYHQLQNN